MTPEFSREFALDHIGGGASMTVEAAPAERQALASRMGIPAIVSLGCHFRLHIGEAGAVLANGHLAARVVQTCVVSLEDFESAIEEDFRVRFVPHGSEGDDLDLEAEDEIPYTGSSLDLGEAAAEQLALCLDPFPRKPGAAVPEEAGEAPDNPFAGLRKLRQ